MEKLSFSLKTQTKVFVFLIWSKWTEYIKPKQSDFYWTVTGLQGSSFKLYKIILYIYIFYKINS